MKLYVNNYTGALKTEVFIVDLPNDLSTASSNIKIQGTETTRSEVPSRVKKRRVTYLKMVSWDQGIG